MATDSRAHLFVSHSSEDKAFVKMLTDELKKRRLNVWVDHAELKVGDSIISKISEGLEATDYWLVVLSKVSVSSEWVRVELNAALIKQIAGKGFILPVLIEDCEVPVLLKDRRYADFRHDFKAGLQQLLDVFEQEWESTEDVTPESATEEVTPCSKQLSVITLADLRRRITTRMDRGEIGTLWYDVLETKMENDMAGRPYSDCVIDLLERAKNRNKLFQVINWICNVRPDLKDPQTYPQVAHRV